MLFANPCCWHTLEDPRLDKCTSGSGFNEERFSSCSRWQREKRCCAVWPQGAAGVGLGQQPLHQLSLTASEELAPNRNLTQRSLPFLPSDLFCAFSTKSFFFSVAKIIYWFPLFSLAQFSSTLSPPLSGQTLYNSVGISSVPRCSSTLPFSTVAILSSFSTESGITNPETPSSLG